MHEQAFGLPVQHTRLLLLRCCLSIKAVICDWYQQEPLLLSLPSTECESSGTKADAQRISFTPSFSCLVVSSVCIDMAVGRFQCTWVSGQAGVYQCVCTHTCVYMYSVCCYEQKSQLLRAKFATVIRGKTWDVSTLKVFVSRGDTFEVKTSQVFTLITVACFVRNN